MIKDREIQAAIKSIQAGTAAEVTLNDGAEGKGMGSLKLVVRPSTRANGVAALWFASWKADGKRLKKQIGRYPDISLQDARKKFRDEVSPLIQTGHNPQAARRVDAPTVGALFAAYIDHLEAEGTRTIKEIRRVLIGAKDNCADGIGRLRLAGDISPADVAGYLSKAFNRGARRQADIQRTMMAAAFNWGIKSTHDYRTDKRGDWGIKFNPVAMVPKDAGANRVRERNLSAAELRALWAGMSDNRFSLEVSACFKLLICCGQRVRETLRADGKDFDLQAGLWNMPGEKTKGGKPHTLPLPRQAIPIIEELISINGMGPLFPSRLGASTPYIMDTSINHALHRWNKVEQLEAFTTKDLRRTWKSRTADAGIDRFMRDLIQQHAKNDTGSKNYDRADYLPQMREAMRKWGEWLESNVVQKQQHEMAA
jgi:integrase